MEPAPGLPVRIVVKTDRRRGGVLVTDSTVYEVDGDTLVLAQTAPPLCDETCGGEISVTYLVEEEGGPKRYGFPAAITAYIDDYGPAPGGRAQALRVSRKARPAPCSIRACYRVEPTPMTRLDLYVGGEKVTIVDISLGGVRFSYDRSMPLEAGVSLRLCFYVAGEEHAVDARVLRTAYARGRLKVAVAEFESATGRFEQALARKIYAIQREWRRR